MNAKLVDAALRSDFWPILRKQSFRVSGRNAYRATPLGYDVVTIQSVGARLGCGASSFAVNLGIRLRGVPPEHAALRLRECHCELRHRLHRGIDQVARYPDVWCASADGANITALAVDAAAVLTAEGLPWFSRWSDPQEILRALLCGETMTADRTWLPGAVASPHRLAVSGYFVLALGGPAGSSFVIRASAARKATSARSS